MKTPSFIIDKHIKKFNVEKIDFDLEKNIRDTGLDVFSWGRIDETKSISTIRFSFSGELEAAIKLNQFIKDNNLTGDAIIVWSNALISPIKSNINLLSEFAFDILSEDWDVWIFFDAGWIVEKYHEGEISFIKTNGNFSITNLATK